ncbi:MAG: hypothetical protein EOP88_10240 [Verrucomicrobiaceae bacterium]|nr:MAG: hypothetical protein EOP88_10240 [Verrucomicrobiaceae bacterium]
MSVRRPLLIVLTLVGLLLNGLLLFWKLTDPGLSVAGCGGGGCNAVLASRWSQVFGIPVVAPGGVVYVLLLAALLWRKSGVAAFCYAAIGGAALWFIFVQTVFLKQFCPWCMAAHSVGCVIACLGMMETPRRGGLQAGAVAVLALALCQLYGHVPATHRITSEAQARDAPPAAIHERGEGRKVSYDGGRKSFNVSSLPRLGSAQAKHVLIEYHDFQCPACRKMSGFLRVLVEKYPEDICVILLPVPLDRSCNSHLKPTDKGHPGSCGLSRIALAAWRADPTIYQEVHACFLSDPPPDKGAALAFVRERVPAGKLDAALRDPWIDELIQADISDWLSLSAQNRQLPKLLIRDRRILHGIPSGEADFIRVMEKELGL